MMASLARCGLRAAAFSNGARLNRFSEQPSRGRPHLPRVLGWSLNLLFEESYMAWMTKRQREEQSLENFLTV
jgi:hypothetical protein